MARFILFLFVVASMIFISRATPLQRSMPDSPLETSKLDEADQNDPEQMNDEEDVDQYEQEEMDNEEDDELANLPGEVKGYKDDWVTKEAVAEDADLAENPAEGSQLNKRAVCISRRLNCPRHCYNYCHRGRCRQWCRVFECRWVCIRYG